jgi:hypothetical protein
MEGGVMAVRQFHGRDYEIHEISGLKMPFGSLSEALDLVNYLDSCVKSLAPRLAKAEDRITQYQRTNGNLMNEIDRLRIRIAELEKTSDGAES